PRNLPAFPTRRSSDLTQDVGNTCEPLHVLASRSNCPAKTAPAYQGAYEAWLRRRRCWSSAGSAGSGSDGWKFHKAGREGGAGCRDRKSTRLNSSHVKI